MSKTPEASDSRVGELIEKLTPLKNEFGEAQPLRKVELLWQVGDELVKAGIKSPHSMGWRIQERSYISRDMLTKGFQVRCRWPSLKELHRDLPRLADYSSFRCLFPYVVGTRRPNAEMEAQLFERLQSAPPSGLRTLLRQLSGRAAIPRKRNASEEEKSALRVLSDFLLTVDQFLFRQNPEEVCGDKRQITQQQVDWFSRACLALGGAIQPSDVGTLDPNGIPSSWMPFVDTLAFALAMTRGSRFRNSIDRKRFATVASQLQWCKSTNGLKQLRAKQALEVKVSEATGEST